MFYSPRQPWDSLLYRLVEEHYEEFERVYLDRLQANAVRLPIWAQTLVKDAEKLRDDDTNG